VSPKYIYIYVMYTNVIGYVYRLCVYVMCISYVSPEFECDMSFINIESCKTYNYDNGFSYFKIVVLLRLKKHRFVCMYIYR